MAEREEEANRRRRRALTISGRRRRRTCWKKYFRDLPGAKLPEHQVGRLEELLEWRIGKEG